MSDFKAKMHQIRFRLGLRPRPRWGSLQHSPRPPIAGLRGPTSKGMGQGKGGEGKGRDGREGEGREGKGGEGWPPDFAPPHPKPPSAAYESFVCRCLGVVEPITGGLYAGLRLDVGDGVSLWKVDGFCYFGDMSDVDGDVVRRWRPESGLRGGRFMNTCPF